MVSHHTGSSYPIRRISDQHTSCREERYKPTHNIAVLEVRLDRHRTGASTVFLVSGPICFAQQPSWIATRNIQNLRAQKGSSRLSKRLGDPMFSSGRGQVWHRNETIRFGCPACQTAAGVSEGQICNRKMHGAYCTLNMLPRRSPQTGLNYRWHGSARQVRHSRLSLLVTGWDSCDRLRPSTLAAFWLLQHSYNGKCR